MQMDPTRGPASLLWFMCFLSCLLLFLSGPRERTWVLCPKPEPTGQDFRRLVGQVWVRGLAFEICKTRNS